VVEIALGGLGVAAVGGLWSIAGQLARMNYSLSEHVIPWLEDHEDRIRSFEGRDPMNRQRK